MRGRAAVVAHHLQDTIKYYMIYDRGIVYATAWRRWFESASYMSASVFIDPNSVRCAFVHVLLDPPNLLLDTSGRVKSEIKLLHPYEEGLWRLS